VSNVAGKAAVEGLLFHHAEAGVRRFAPQVSFVLDPHGNAALAADRGWARNVR